MNSQCRYLDCRDHFLDILSMGFGFINYLFKASSGKPLKTLQHSRLGDQCLELKRSTRASVNKDNGAKEIVDLCKASTKILVRNIPFQAKKEEIVQLFRTFGEISAVDFPRRWRARGRTARQDQAPLGRCGRLHQDSQQAGQAQHGQEK